MIRLLSTLALVTAALLSSSIKPVAAQPASDGMVRIIVQLKGQSLAENPAFKARTRATLGRYRLDPTLLPARWYARQVQSYQDQEISYLRDRGIQLTVGYRMHIIFNGFLATVPASQLSLLRSSANILTVTPQRKLQPLLDRSLPLVDAPKAWTELGGPAQAGKGLMIGQIDSGIDITNPCFRDTGMPAPPIGRRVDNSKNASLVNNKVIVARAFGSNANKQYSAKDDEGHGTFGAAIEACDVNTKTPLGTTINGVAPAAYLMNYNVFPADDDGSGNDDNLLPAMEAALQDGADVVNMSLGYPLGAGDERLDPDEVGVSRLVRAGVSVVISAGNAGPTTQTVSSPAAASAAISVGATTNSRGLYSAVLVAGPQPVPDNLTKIKSKEGSSAFTDKVGPAPVVLAGYGRRPGDDTKDPKADDFAGKDLHGKIAVIERGSPAGGTVTFETKVKNAAEAGAIGVVLYNNNPADLNPFTPSLGSATLPTMMIDNESGRALVSWIQNHADATVVLDPTIQAYDQSPDVISDYSARGYGANYTIKPDLVAPGDVYSATSTQNKSSDMYSASGFTSEEGTSFSAPHVTGTVALLLQKHPKWTPAMVKSALMQSADTAVYLDDAHTQQATVMDMGAGRLDVAAALDTPAYVSPTSLSFGGINLASGAVEETAKLTVNDAGTGSGTWTVFVHPLDSQQGVGVTTPASAALPANGRVDIPVTLAVSASVPVGAYDGYIVLSNGSQTLHVPYFVHVANQQIATGSVLLVDDTTSRYVPATGQPPVEHVDVTRYYQTALTAIGKRYTYWDEAKQGTPTFADMKQASAVIYFTGANLNMLGSGNPNGLNPPLGSADVTALHDYANAGGRVLVTGKGAAFSDPGWTAVVMGAVATAESAYDTSGNDPDMHGGISPPQPSARPDNGVGSHFGIGPFSGLKAIDFSTKGDGAKTNLAVPLKVQGSTDLFGVPPLKAVNGRDDFYGDIHGHAGLQTTLKQYADVAVVSSDEPSLTHTATYPGRSMLFSFGFEGINDNTGYATRAQVLQRVFQWFDDKPAAHATAKKYRARVKSTLAATYSVSAPARPAVFTWQVGSTKLKTSAKPTQYVFPRPGKYRVRVAMTDSIGHAAVSPWTTVTVR